MELGADIIVLLTLVAFVAATLDAIAGGGGLLVLPALLATGMSPVAALATNKLQSSLGTGGAVLAFARAGRIDWRRFALPALASFVGSAGGAYLVTQINPDFLQGFIPLLLVAITLYFVFGPRISEEDRHSRAGPALLIGMAAIIGAYDGFFGPGTGSFFTAALVALFGLGMVRAIAHTKLLNFASNLAALAVFVVSGDVIWVLGLWMSIGSVAGGQLGARLSMRFGGRAVRPLLILVSLALTARLLADHPLTSSVLAWLA